MVLKALVEKTHPGALIASLSTPLANKVSTVVHKCRLSRCAAARFLLYAMALLALGDSICHLCASHTLTRD